MGHKSSKGLKSGDKFTLAYGNGSKSRFAVLHVFPTKAHADGPLPSTLLRLIKAGGGAAFVELLPVRGERAHDDTIIGPGHSLPRHYVIALDSRGEKDGYPVGLAPHQVKRIRQYLR